MRARRRPTPRRCRSGAPPGPRGTTSGPTTRASSSGRTRWSSPTASASSGCSRTSFATASNTATRTGQTAASRSASPPPTTASSSPTTGRAIAAADRARVFEPGYTADGSGTGLGLTIVERIAHAHGWTVSAGASDAGGAAFRFDLGGV
ncbi:ATP-binding protein [Halapricum sp. CBA1109]|uniref:ATP-binding protein n=1 Tax=Halapricum sp. CBA1109 TaxID=2668068 RepID=UPI00351B3FF4